MLYAFVNGEIVGRLNVRHKLNDELLIRGGHIGYAVSPRYRKNGYATEIFRQGLMYCQNLGLQKILVTCSDLNIPSWKVIEKFAADLENRIPDVETHELIRRYWVDVLLSISDDFKFQHKVVAYVIRKKDTENQLLVFDHDLQFADAGTQVPAGSVDGSEKIEDAILREVFEESGLKNFKNIEKIDEYLFFSDGSKKYLKRYVFCLQISDTVPDQWTHKVSGGGSDQKMNFHYYWINLNDISVRLSARFGDSVAKIKNI